MVVVPEDAVSVVQAVMEIIAVKSLVTVYVLSKVHRHKSPVITVTTDKPWTGRKRKKENASSQRTFRIRGVEPRVAHTG